MIDAAVEPADPLIEEVRERRRQLLAEHGNDLDRLLVALRRAEAETPAKVVDLRVRRASAAKS